MPTNINIVITDNAYKNLRTIKEEARFRTNADVIQFALEVAVHSETFEKLKKGRLTEAIPPTPEKSLQKFIHEVVENEMRKLKEKESAKTPEKTSRKRVRQGDLPPPKNLAARDLQTVPNSSNILGGDTLYRTDGSCLPRAAIRGVKQKNE